MQICVPDIGDVDEVEVIELCVSVGDVLAVDEPVVVIESDKASMEVPSPVAGVVRSIAVALGDAVKQGDVLAEIETEEAGASAQPAAEQPAAAPPAPVAEPAEPPTAAPAANRAVMDVLVPDIGDAGDVVVIEVAVAAGDEVAENDLLVVLESDKASMEIPSPQAGRIVEVLVALDDTVTTGTLLLKLQGLSAQSPSVVEEPVAAQAPTAAPTPAVAPLPASPSPSDDKPEHPSAAVATSGKQVYAGPSVRRLARELGVDLELINGKGPRGRITKDDVKVYVKDRMSASPTAGGSQGAGIPPVPSVDFAKFGEVELEPITRIRRVGAANLHRSWLNVPHVTQHDEADVTELESFRKSLKPEAERRGVKVTPLAFLVKACCETLKAHPRMNSSLDAMADNFVIKKYYNIGLAVDTPQGLVVPVIKDADKKGVWELCEEIAELATKARDSKLGMGDLSGGTFSISSLGAIGGTGFTPIVNAPEVGILGVGRMAMKPVWDGSDFVPRKMLPLSLSYDHRVINGADAGRFVTDLTSTLADMRRALL